MKTTNILETMAERPHMYAKTQGEFISILLGYTIGKANGLLIPGPDFSQFQLDDSVKPTREWARPIVNYILKGASHMETSAKVIFSKNQINKEKTYIVSETQVHDNLLYYYTSVVNGQHLYNTFHEYDGKQFLAKEDLDNECCLNQHKPSVVFIAELA